MFWPRCATPRTLPSSSPLLSIAIAVVFGIGLALFGLGSVARRKQAPPQASQKRVTWPRLVDDSLGNLDLDQRIEMIGRLGIIRSSWSRGVLAQAQREESDVRAKAAIGDALNAKASASVSPATTRDT